MKSYFLIGPDDEIYLLPAKKTVTIGRAPINEVSLDDCCVSRLHALITPSATGPVLTDCGSTNGTLVNGHAAGEIALHHGDAIQMGKYVFFVRHETREEAEGWTRARGVGTKMDQTQPIERGATRRGGVKDVVGDLAAFQMVALLQALVEQRRDGSLELRNRRRVYGHIFLADGAIVHAETADGAKGKEALFALMALEEGQFTFEPESRSPFVSVFENPISLLIEGCHRLDEKHGATPA